jgi:ABC-type nitrate/sulfonate/bicarbonate transport system permease component
MTRSWTGLGTRHARSVAMRGMTRSRSGRLVLQLLLPIALVWAWWWTSRGSTSYFWPALTDIIGSIRSDWLFDQFMTDLVPSLMRFTLGYILAVSVGIAAGTLIGLLPRLRRATAPVTEFVRAIPPPLLLPFVIVTLGIGDGSKIVVIALGAVWPVLLNTADGVRGVDRLTVDMARSYGLGPWRRVFHVILPGASPKIAVGMRIGLAVALILMIISEMVGSTNGLGFRVLDAQRSFDAAGTYGGVIVIGIVGLIVNAGFLVAETRIMRWYRGSRGLVDG